MSTHATLDIKIMGREFRVLCPPDDREALLAAAARLEQEMTQIAAATKSSGERLAVMAALNLAHQLTAAEGGVAAPSDSAGLQRRISAMEARLDDVLGDRDIP